MTMQAIQHIELTSATNTITFSSIPQTYTDLMVVTSLRGATFGGILLNASNSNTSGRVLWGLGSSVLSGPYTGFNYNIFQAIGRSGDTANSFGNSSIYIANYTSSSGKTLLLDSVNENNATEAYHIIGTGYWNNSAAVSSFSITSLDANLNSSGTFAVGSSATLYGISKYATAASPKATGGIISFANGYWVHTFTGSGTFTPSENINNVEYVVVAGGGGGGSDGGAGGGAGGYRSSVVGEFSGGGASAESRLSLTSGTNYTVTIGAGGTSGVAGTTVTNGSNSVFGSITATGGGRGAYYNGINANSGGSGGGGSYFASYTGGAGTSNQGYAGGNSAGEPYISSAGGGGAGAVGGNTSSQAGGVGGIGVQSSITGTAIYRAGGGGGGPSYLFGTAAQGGLGGGANSQVSQYAAPAAARANTGGGGGGAVGGAPGGIGSNGGSGIVIVRYPA